MASAVFPVGVDIDLSMALPVDLADCSAFFRPASSLSRRAMISTSSLPAAMNSPHFRLDVAAVIMLTSGAWLFA